MPRFVAFLRGVSPLNCQMSRLRDVLGAAGFKSVRTVLSSGNAAFDADTMSEAELERKLEELLRAEFGRGFFPIVRMLLGWSSSPRATLSRRFHCLTTRSASLVFFVRKLGQKSPFRLPKTPRRFSARLAGRC